MENPLKISLIIPAFNVEKYIEKCILSLLQQDMDEKEYEIIIINDGSKDNTAVILHELSQRYSNLNYITTTNQGVGTARNLGIERAKGSVIMFIDADDYLTPNCLNRIYNTIKENDLDILLFDYNYWSNQGKLLKGFDYEIRKVCPEGIVSGKEYIQKGFFPATVWMLAYKKEYIQEKKFRFINIRHEDEEFTPRILYFAEKVEHLTEICYNYIQNSTSFMQNYGESGLIDKIKAMDSLNQFKELYIKEKEIYSAFEKHISLVLMGNFMTSFTLESKMQLRMIKQMKNANLNPVLHKQRKSHMLLYKYFPLLFIAYYRQRYIRGQRKTP